MKIKSAKYGILVLILSIIGFVQCSESEVAEAIIGNGDIMSTPTDYGPDFDFIYYVGSRFNKTVSKEIVHEAKSVLDIIPEEVDPEGKTFHNVKVTRNAVKRSDWIEVEGDNEVFNDEQVKALKSLDYGANFSVSMRVKDLNADDSEVEVDLVEQRKQLGFLTNFGNSASSSNLDQTYGLRKDSIIRYITVVPAVRASYLEGKNALIDYIKEEAKDFVVIARRSSILPGKVSFAIDREGKITDVKLTESCNYPSIDKKMIDLVKGIPGTWKAGQDAKGEYVQEELVLFFGNMGC